MIVELERAINEHHNHFPSFTPSEKSLGVAQHGSDVVHTLEDADKCWKTGRGPRIIGFCLSVPVPLCTTERNRAPQARAAEG